jgi:hypothetical protein
MQGRFWKMKFKTSLQGRVEYDGLEKERGRKLLTSFFLSFLSLNRNDWQVVGVQGLRVGGTVREKVSGENEFNFPLLINNLLLIKSWDVTAYFAIC